MSTKPDIFIIESLKPDDEGNGRLEGPSIIHIAKLHGKCPIYRYVRTRKEFEKAIRAFLRSDYRYLHISAHADRNGIATTNQDDISNTQLAAMLGASCGHRRLFLSACRIVHKQMAVDLIPATGCLSIAGPRRKIGFEEAAVFWPSLYHLMFTNDTNGMRKSALAKELRRLAELFTVEIGLYGRSSSRQSGFTRDILKA